MANAKRGKNPAKLPPNLEWRGGLIRFRMKWPARVVKARTDLRGKDFTKSLGTSDIKAALRSAGEARIEFEQVNRPGFAGG